MRRCTRWAAMLACALLLLAALWLARVALLPRLAQWLDVGGQPVRADYVMILGGGAATRPFVAAALVRAGLAHKVLLAHVKPNSAESTGSCPRKTS